MIYIQDVNHISSSVFYDYQIDMHLVLANALIKLQLNKVIMEMGHF